MAFEDLPAPDRVREAFEATWSDLAGGGTWWTGTEQLHLAAVARAAFGERFSPPWMRPLTAEARAEAEADGIDETATAAIVTLSADAHTIDREWATDVTTRIGDAAYVELVAIAATMAVVDAFATAIDVAPAALPDRPTDDSDPPRVRPDGMGEAGAYVDMAVPWSDANVARALTLSPTANTLYRRVGVALYHEGQFLDLDWDRPLSRPQAELLATTVSAANECFY